MIGYTNKPLRILEAGSTSIASFVSNVDSNIDWKTVNSFGKEWAKFKVFSNEDIETIGKDYFDLVNESMLSPKTTIALDVGCGSGRWAKYLRSKVKFIEAIDPSHSVFTASTYLHESKNIRITHASVDQIPFPDQSFDFVYSLGVLHHLPDTKEAIQKCYDKLKPGGWFLVYLYYNLDNRSALFKFLFWLTNIFREVISRTPNFLKSILCDIIALVVYFPLAKLSHFTNSLLPTLAQRIPLSYYKKTSFSIMRNDALDRFGTPLEKRFSKNEISLMLSQCGFKKITISEKAPYWHAIAKK